MTLWRITGVRPTMRSADYRASTEVEKAVAVLNPPAGERAVEPGGDVSDDISCVWAAPNEVHSKPTNLIANALHARGTHFGDEDRDVEEN